MFGMGFTEVLLILAIALVVLGPERLPGIAKALGRAMREFRKATREIRTSLEVEEVRRTLRERVDDERAASNWRDKVDFKKDETSSKSDDLAGKKQYLSDGERQKSVVKMPKRPPVPAEGSQDVSETPGGGESTDVAPERDLQRYIDGADDVPEPGDKGDKPGEPGKGTDVA